MLGSLVLLYLGVTLLVDPRCHFGTSIFPCLTLDSRRDKMRLFAEYNRLAPIEGLILGSSRSMKLSCAELQKSTGLRWFNFSVDSARTEDYLAIYRWTRASDAKLKALVIGLDVEALHDLNELDDRLKSNPALMAVLDDARPSVYSRTSDFLGLMKTVFSRYFAQDVLRSVRAAFVRLPASSTFDSDGFLHYIQWEDERAAGTFDLRKNLEKSRAEYRQRFIEMQGLSVRRRAHVERLIKEVQQDNVQVVLWITPVHTDLAAFLDRTTGYSKRLEETRLFAVRLQVEYGLPVLDFSTPSTFGATDAGWYDGGHMDEDNALLVVDRLTKELK